MRAAIFVGPTLPPRLRPTDPIWEWHPPVRQGDVYRVAQTRPDAIGIIDGYFEAVPTVWHKEILWAMAEGIPVYGAASIGALRAAELDVFGMRGVGRIYEDFRDGVLVDDDEVAVLHGPEELGYPVLTEAMVNVRVTLGAVMARGVVEVELAELLISTAKKTFYKERNWLAVIASALPNLGRGLIDEFAHRLDDSRVNLKEDDAAALLRRVRIDLASTASFCR